MHSKWFYETSLSLTCYLDRHDILQQAGINQICVLLLCEDLILHLYFCFYDIYTCIWYMYMYTYTDTHTQHAHAKERSLKFYQTRGRVPKKPLSRWSEGQMCVTMQSLQLYFFRQCPQAIGWNSIKKKFSLPV